MRERERERLRELLWETREEGEGEGKGREREGRTKQLWRGEKRGKGGADTSLDRDDDGVEGEGGGGCGVDDGEEEWVCAKVDEEGGGVESVRMAKEEKVEMDAKTGYDQICGRARVSTTDGGCSEGEERGGEGRTNLEHRVPTTRAQRHPIRTNSQTTNPVLMPRQNAHPLPLERIPNVAVKVIVTGKEDSSRDGETDRGDTAEDVVVRELVQLAVGAEVEEAAGGVIGTGREGVAVGEEAGRDRRRSG